MNTLGNTNRSIVIRPVARLFAMTFLLIQACPLAWSQETWYPSKYGPDDTIGAANNQSPDIVRKAAQLVTKGKVYSLAIVTGLLLQAMQSMARRATTRSSSPRERGRQILTIS